MTKLTTRKVNTELKRAGYKLALQKENGYFYFYVQDQHHAEWDAKDCVLETTHSVYVCSINQLTLEEWLDHANDANFAIWGEQ